MDLFAKILVNIYSDVASVNFVAPPVFLSRIKFAPLMIRKYFGYIDKFVIFSIYLLGISRSYDLVHIADHSNAIYAFFVPRARVIITCHDLLAVRGAFGDDSVACKASPIGIWLQRLIITGLRRAKAIVFDSHATYSDFLTLGGGPLCQRHKVIPIPLNSPFTHIASTFRLSDSELDQIPSTPYLLMVGSSLPRKNRDLALRLLEFLGHASPYSLVFAGDELTITEQNFRSSHSLGYRLHSVVRPSHALLNTLYCNAYALLFPSFSEGFGWPLVEAQTCHCPVIASTSSSIPEVAGDGALYSAPNDVKSFADHVLALQDLIFRDALIRRGCTNILRYNTNIVSQDYLSFAFSI